MVGIAVSAGAGAQPALAVTTQQLNGNPLTIWIGDNGSFQDLVAGNTDNSFFPPHSANANAGFVLAFPTGQTGAYADPAVDGKVWGWTSDGGGPTLNGSFTPVSQSAWTGSGTDPDPYTQVTKYQLKPAATALLEVDQTATYVNGLSSFVITYVVKELVGDPVKFRALVGADIYLNSSDCGTGTFKAGPPRLVGGSSLGRVGGFTEAPAPSPPWTHYFEGRYGFPPGACQIDPTISPGVWDYLQGAASGPGFPDTVDSSFLDNGIGIQWDTYYTSPLAANASSAPFQLNTLGTVPGELILSPSSQTVKAGENVTLTATALDSSGAAAAGIPVRFSVSGANSGGSVVTTNGSGQTTISYTADKPGSDTVSAFEDLDGNGVRGQGEPAATATVTVQAQAPPPRDTVPPKLKIVVPQSLKRKSFIRGLTAIVTSNESSSLKFELLGARRPSLRARSFTRTLARQVLPLSGAGTRAARLRPSRRLVGRVRRFKVQLRVTAVDRSGNKTVETRTIRVR